MAPPHPSFSRQIPASVRLPSALAIIFQAPSATLAPRTHFSTTSSGPTIASVPAILLPHPSYHLPRPSPAHVRTPPTLSPCVLPPHSSFSHQAPPRYTSRPALITVSQVPSASLAPRTHFNTIRHPGESSCRVPSSTSRSPHVTSPVPHPPLSAHRTTSPRAWPRPIQVSRTRSPPRYASRPAFINAAKPPSAPLAPREPISAPRYESGRGALSPCSSASPLDPL